MTDRPIIFSAPMVRALLSGSKTQTRRILKLPPAPAHLGDWEVSTIGGDGVTDSRGRPVRERPCLWHSRNGAVVVPAYVTGDRLYVREAWSHTGVAVWTIEDARRSAYSNGHPIYRATDDADAGTKFWPSIHMPREFSRLTLIVESVKVERLQAISNADALAEGLLEYPQTFGPSAWGIDALPPATRRLNAGNAFAQLWASLHTKEGERWEDDPWVVCISFAVKHGNIDQ